MTQTRTFNVPDMSCEHCELSVQEALGEVDGVRSSRADHLAGTVEVTYEAEKTSNAQFRQAVAEVGYTLRA